MDNKLPGLEVGKTNDIDDGKEDIILTFNKERTGYEGHIIISQEMYLSLGFTYEQMKTDHNITGAILHVIGSGILKGATRKSSTETSTPCEEGAKPGDNES